MGSALSKSVKMWDLQKPRNILEYTPLDGCKHKTAHIQHSKCWELLVQSTTTVNTNTTFTTSANFTTFTTITITIYYHYRSDLNNLCLHIRQWNMLILVVSYFKWLLNYKGFHLVATTCPRFHWIHNNLQCWYKPNIQCTAVCGNFLFSFQEWQVCLLSICSK